MLELIELGGVAIRQNEQRLYNINDLHKAAVAGGANKRTTEPAKFFRSPHTKGLVALLEAESVANG